MIYITYIISAASSQSFTTLKSVLYHQSVHFKNAHSLAIATIGHKGLPHLPSCLLYSPAGI